MLKGNPSKFFLASIVESSRDSIMTIDLDMIITSWNAGAAELYGYPAEEAIGKHMTMLTLPKELTSILSNIEKIEEIKRVEIYDSERVRKGGRHIIVEIMLSPVKDDTGRIIGMSTIARDMTEHRKAEKAMRDKEALRDLVLAQDSERKRISRNVHDNIGQQLTVLGLALQRAKQLCKDEATCNEITRIQSMVGEADKSLDFLAWELRPAPPPDIALGDAIDSYLKQWSSYSGVSAELIALGLKKSCFSAEIESNLYCIVQEALNNTQKHAAAESVLITLQRKNGSLKLIITDDGKGFPLKNKAKKNPGLGLIGMRERTALIGGTLEIESSRKNGTTIYISVPVKGT